MKGFGAWSVTRPVATMMIVVAVAVFGWVSYRQIPISLMPELNYPTLTVRTELRGAAPQEIEETVTKPIEDILRTVEGVVGISSVSRAGQSDVVLRFGWDTKMDFATQKVRERVELVPLPEEVETPMLLRYDPDLDPIVRVGVSGPVPAAELRKATEDEIQPELEKIEGVAMVRVRGGLEEVIRVDLDPGRMSALGVTAGSVSSRLQAENINVAGGALSEGDVTYLVRTLNAFEDLQEMNALVVAYPDGVPVRLSQVATIHRDTREPEVYTRVGHDGVLSDSIVVEIYKEADANLVEVADRVKDALYGSKSDLSARASDLAKSHALSSVLRAKMMAAGTVGLAEAAPSVRSRLLLDRLPNDVVITPLSDQSIFIRKSLDEVKQTALWGGLFAVLVIFAFLRSTWSTMIISVSIPLSVIAAFGALRLAGVTLNVMSLGGIALGIGMLVDNSIVVLESIFRCREEGDDLMTAALRGTKEVGSAVVASTLTTIAVFLPIVFVEGVAGQIFGDLALSVVFSLLASLAVAMLFVPMVAAREPGVPAQIHPLAVVKWLVRPLSAWTTTRQEWAAWRTQKGTIATVVTPIIAVFLLARLIILLSLELVFGRVIAGAIGLFVALAVAVLKLLAVVFGWVVKPFFAGFDYGYSKLESAYPRLLKATLRARFTVTLAAFALFGGALWMFGELDTELLPAMHQGEFTVRVAMPVGTKLEETSRIVQSLETQMLDVPQIARFATTVGVERTALQTSDEGEHTARIAVVLVPTVDPALAEDESMTAIRALAAKMPGATIEIERPTMFAFRTPLEIEVVGDDLRTLRSVSDEIVAELRQDAAFADVRSNLGRGFPEVQISLKRDRLAALGMTAREVGEAIRDQIRGVEPTKLREADDDITVIVRADPADIPDVASLKTLVVRPATAQVGEVRLESVADILLSVGPSEIRHVDGNRAAVISADVPVTSLSSAIAAADKTLRSSRPPTGISLEITGQSRDMDEAQASMFFALLLAVFLVYVVMASTFESIIGPFVILLSIPLALIGVTAALVWTGINVSVLVFIGLIMLEGMVVNNAIVLVDYIQQLRQRGESLIDATVDACRVRLRPVLITTLTTVLGLMPMAMGLGEGAELRRPLAVTVVAGLSSSTLLTLLLVPAVFVIAMSIREKPSVVE
ncbi:MAG: efflux RND transporter permease subunit [bacterium]